MYTLVIHDTTGFAVSIQQGELSPRVPIGLPYIIEKIPPGKELSIIDGIAVDITKTPPQLILKDSPISDSTRIKELEDTMAAMLMGGVV